MLATYPAVLKGDRLEWSQATPPLPSSGEGVPVYVIILSGSEEATAPQGERMATILSQLAAGGGILSIPDPLAWQREIRQDRPLPGRDD